MHAAASMRMDAKGRGREEEGDGVGERAREGSDERTNAAKAIIAKHHPLGDYRDARPVSTHIELAHFQGGTFFPLASLLFP